MDKAYGYKNMNSDPTPFMQKLRDVADERFKAIYGQREEICEAFIAETGLRPSEIMQIEQRMDDGTVRWYLEKKADVMCEPNVKLVNLLKEANRYCGEFKLSNDCADNLNRKDRAFLAINKRISKALKLLKED